MSALLAIVGDTWRQSRQQVVFVILLVLLALLVGLAVFLPGRERPVLTAWRGRGLGAFAGAGTPLTCAGDPVALAAGDLDGDGDLDLLAVSGAAPSSTLLNDGRGGFAAGPALDAAADAVWLADLDGDRDADAVLLRGEQGASVWRNEGGARFAAAGPALGAGALDVALADLDGDRDLDLVVAEREGPARVWLNDGRGAFSPGPALGPGRRVAVADVDADGRPDVALLLPEGVAVWRAGPAGYALDFTLPGQHLSTLAAADLDGDGRAEVLAAGQRDPVLWLCRGPATWEPATATFRQRGVARALVADANGDGKPDLCLVGGERGVVYQNTTRAGYTEPTFAQSQLLPAGVTQALVLLHADPDGQLDAAGVAGVHGLDLPGLERDGQDHGWQYLYASMLIVLGRGGEREQVEQRAAELTLERRARTTDLQRDVEFLVIWMSKLVYTLSMVLFIAACAGYFPGLLQEGAVDVVLARPLSRLQVFLGKYLGGLALYAAALLLAYGLLVLGIGLRFGCWLPSIFWFVPIQLFSAAALYAVLACLGILVRSTALPLLAGLFLYLGVDTALELAIKVKNLGVITNDVAREAIDLAQVLLPNFGLLKEVATASVFGVEGLPLQPLVTAGVWLLVFLGLGYLRFRAADY